MRIGRLRHQVQLQTPTVTDDGAGGFSETWADLTPSSVPASIEPADVQRLERLAAGTVESNATHIVSMRYHAGVTTKTRVLLGTRVLQVTGVRNPQELNLQTIAICTEVVV